MKTIPSNSIIIKFIYMLLLIFVIPFSTILFISTKNIAILESKSANEYLSSNLKIVSSTIDEILKNIETLYISLYTDSNFMNATKKLLPYDIKDEYSDFNQTNTIRESLSKISLANNYIYSVYNYSFTANRFFSSKVNWDPEYNNFNADNYDWFQSYKNSYSQNNASWAITSTVESDMKILSFYQEIYDANVIKPIALLSINIDGNIISDLLKKVNIDYAGYSFIVDSNNKIISNTFDSTTTDTLFKEILYQMPTDQTEGFYSIELDNKEILISFYTSPYSHLKFIAAADNKSIETIAPIMKRLTIIFLVFCVLISIFSLVLAYHYFFKPIKAMFLAMKEVENSNFDIQLPRDSSFEIGYINNNFNKMVTNLKTLITENYVNTIIAKESQLKTFQNQLNEHFLYNTLDSIHWIARSENANKVCKIVFSLASFYRLSLSSGKDIVTINEICEMMKNYLYIQKIRMQDLLTYEINVDKTISGQTVSKYLFQPIVENAIIHGIKNSTKQGKIIISFVKNDESIIFSVEDNGVGISPEKLLEINNILDSNTQYCEDNFALKTIQSQLKIFYGENSKLNIESKKGYGTKVWFNI